MKILIRILQVALALWTITGAIYMMGHYEELASDWAYDTFPAIFWKLLGIVEIILAIGLLISVRDSFRRFAAPSAIGIAIIFLAGLFLYSAYTGLTGMLWAIIPAALFLLVAYKRRLSAQ